MAAILDQLKTDGYSIAVADFSSDAACCPLYQMADIIGVYIGDRSQDQVLAVTAAAMTYPATTLAWDVMDRQRFTLCRDLGTDLFQGAFFKTPDVIQMRQLSSNAVARLNLLHAIEQNEKEVDFDRLAETIQADAAISFRLLAYLNSAAFGLRQKVKSVHQAISLLGWRKMKNWLRVVLLTDVSQRREAQELTTLAAQRGKFLELIGQAYDYWGFDPESLHLLGIFSLLDAMLDIPMAEAVDYLPLDDRLKAALCAEPNNEYRPLMRLAVEIEEARWPEVEQMVQQLNLDMTQVKLAFQKAVDWANELTTLHAAPQPER